MIVALLFVGLLIYYFSCLPALMGVIANKKSRPLGIVITTLWALIPVFTIMSIALY